jgi:hypothetical protein
MSEDVVLQYALTSVYLQIIEASCLLSLVAGPGLSEPGRAAGDWFLRRGGNAALGKLWIRRQTTPLRQRPDVESRATAL